MLALRLPCTLANCVSEFTCFASQTTPGQSLNHDIKLRFSEQTDLLCLFFYNKTAMTVLKTYFCTMCLLVSRRLGWYFCPSLSTELPEKTKQRKPIRIQLQLLLVASADLSEVLSDLPKSSQEIYLLHFFLGFICHSTNNLVSTFYDLIWLFNFLLQLVYSLFFWKKCRF